MNNKDAIALALEESNSLLCAMLHETRPADEITAQILQNRAAIELLSARDQQKPCMWVRKALMFPNEPDCIINTSEWAKIYAEYRYKDELVYTVVPLYAAPQAAPTNQEPADDTKWVLTHNGKTVIGDRLMDVMRQGQSLRTDEETLIAHANLMGAIDEKLQAAPKPEVVAWMLEFDSDDENDVTLDPNVMEMWRTLHTNPYEITGLCRCDAKEQEQGRDDAIRPTYYVRHPDNSYSVAEPQPKLKEPK